MVESLSYLIHEGRQAPMGESEPVSQNDLDAFWCEVFDGEKTK